MTRLVRQQFSPQQVRVLVRGFRDFIKEGFGEESVLRMVNTSPSPKGHVCRAVGVVDMLGCHVVGNDRRFNGLMLLVIDVIPRENLAIAVESGAEL